MIRGHRGTRWGSSWEPTDKALSYKAHMSTQDAEILEYIILSMNDINILEWGSGRSTEYFVKLLTDINYRYNYIAIEHQVRFYNAMLKYEHKYSRFTPIFAINVDEYLYHPKIRGIKADLIMGRNVLSLISMVLLPVWKNS